jgi:hypothetical protein
MRPRTKAGGQQKAAVDPRGSLKSHLWTCESLPQNVRRLIIGNHVLDDRSTKTGPKMKKKKSNSSHMDFI